MRPTPRHLYLTDSWGFNIWKFTHEGEFVGFDLRVHGHTASMGRSRIIPFANWTLSAPTSHAHCSCDFSYVLTFPCPLASQLVFLSNQQTKALLPPLFQYYHWNNQTWDQTSPTYFLKISVSEESLFIHRPKIALLKPMEPNHRKMNLWTKIHLSFLFCRNMEERP